MATFLFFNLILLSQSAECIFGPLKASNSAGMCGALNPPRHDILQALRFNGKFITNQFQCQRIFLHNVKNVLLLKALILGKDSPF